MSDSTFMRLALRLARRGYGTTSPNPMVGALLVKAGNVIGRGWHRRAGGPHAEVEAIRDAQKRKKGTQGAILYVTLEPCCTHGLTPPCTDAIKAAGIKRVVVGAMDPNPRHAGKGFKILKSAGIEVVRIEGSRARHSAHAAGRNSKRRARSDAAYQQLAGECARLNEAFNHWIVQRTPFVTVKAAMTLDGKIATASGESKWITGDKARSYGMMLRRGSDAVLVGINTILNDDPALTFRPTRKSEGNIQHPTSNTQYRTLRRIVLDSMARTPLAAKVVTDDQAAWTTIAVSKFAPKSRVAALAKRVRVLVAPGRKRDIKNRNSKIDLRWLLKQLGAEEVTSLLVEGGGEVNASFLLEGLAQRVAFFYAPKILGGRDSRKAVAADGVKRLDEIIQLRAVQWKRLGPDLLLTAKVEFTL